MVRLANGAERMELTGWSLARLDGYKAQGCFTKIIRFPTRLFGPIEGARHSPIGSICPIECQMALSSIHDALWRNAMLALHPVDDEQAATHAWHAGALLSPLEGREPPGAFRVMGVHLFPTRWASTRRFGSSSRRVRAAIRARCNARRAA